MLYLSADAAIDRFVDGGTRTWMIYLAVATDLFGDGLMIGAGSASDSAAATNEGPIEPEPRLRAAA